jgi:hypothetical protein
VIVYIVEVGTVHALQAMRGLQPAVGTTIILEDLLPPPEELDDIFTEDYDDYLKLNIPH